MIIDVSTYIGTYPYRHLPWHDAKSLIAAMDRTDIDMAWVGSMGAFVHNDPRPANHSLIREVFEFRDRLVPIPTIHPDQPRWEKDLELARNASAPAIRVFPMHCGVNPAGEDMKRLCRGVGEQGMATQLTVRFEDMRQRVFADQVTDLPASAVRELARLDHDVRLLISNAPRDFIEEVHFGLSDSEAERVVWDIAWLWGPPADDLMVLAETIGIERFVFGSLMPLRIPEAPIARLDLSGFDEPCRAAVEYGNLTAWQSRGR